MEELFAQSNMEFSFQLKLDKWGEGYLSIVNQPVWKMLNNYIDIIKYNFYPIIVVILMHEFICKDSDIINNVNSIERQYWNTWNE